MFNDEELKIIAKALDIAKRQSVKQIGDRVYLHGERSGAIHYEKNKKDASEFNMLSNKVKSLISK